MGAAEWDTSHDPDAMLEAAEGRLSDRELLLFACGSARLLWDWLPDFATTLVPRIEVAADLPDADRATAVRDAVTAVGGMTAAALLDAIHPERPYAAVRQAVALLRWLDHRKNAGAQSLLVTGFSLLWESSPFVHRPNREQAAVLRCVAGNPFCETHFDPAWRTSSVLALAARADAHPILADALQDAGCDDAAVLDHLRGDAPHARGCWVVSRISGRGGAESVS